MQAVYDVIGTRYVATRRPDPRLADDLRSGRWARRFGPLREQDSADLGYRLRVVEPATHGPRQR